MVVTQRLPKDGKNHFASEMLRAEQYALRVLIGEIRSMRVRMRNGPIASCSTPDPQQEALFGEVLGPGRGTSFWEEVHHWEQALRVHRLTLLPVLSISSFCVRIETWPVGSCSYLHGFPVAMFSASWNLKLK